MFCFIDSDLSVLILCLRYEREGKKIILPLSSGDGGEMKLRGAQAAGGEAW